MCRSLCVEFRRPNLGLGPTTAQGTVQDWRAVFGRGLLGPCSSVIFRFLTAAVMSFVLAWSIHEWVYSDDMGWGEKMPLFFIYLTHTTLTIQTVYHIASLLVALRASRTVSCCTDRRSRGDTIPCLVRFSWLLQAVVLPSSFVVFAMYWALVYDGSTTLVSIFKHGVNFAVMFVDSFFSGYPYQLAHSLYPMLYAVLYLGWTVLHWALKIEDPHGEEEDIYIYESLDWDHPSKTAVTCAGVVFVVFPLANALFYLLFACRDRCLPNQGFVAFSTKRGAQGGGSRAGGMRAGEPQKAVAMGTAISVV